MDPTTLSTTPHYLTTMLSPAQTYLLTTTLTLLLPPLLALYIHNDYKAFLSLGPGGTPPTPLGYLKIKLLSLVCMRDPYPPMPIPPHFRPQAGYLGPLAPRKGTRPLVQGIAPQRQRTQRSPSAIYASLVTRLAALSLDPRNHLVQRTSCFEKNSAGLFTSSPITRTCGGEICHVHPSDGSLHLTLHPADAKVLLERRWGERHPLARGGWCRRFVPKEFVLVYAPRDQAEVEVIMGIVAASIWWVSGVDVHGEKNREDVEDAEREAVEIECWACKARGCAGTKVETMMGDA
jgi:hypothetical protein